MPTERYDATYDKQVAESIRSLFELTSRIDERVNNIIENHKRFEATFKTISDNQLTFLQRVTALEATNGHDLKKVIEELNERIRRLEIQVQAIEFIAKGSQTKWDRSIEYGMKILVALAAAILAFKLTTGR